MGEKLSRKVGPLPLWAWALILAAGGYLLYRRSSGKSGSSGDAVQTQTFMPTSGSAALGAVPSAGSTGDTGQSTSDLVSALGGQQAELLSALEAQSQDILGMAQSQIAAAQTQTTLGSFSTQTQPVSAPMPGGANVPQIIYVSPQIVTTPAAKPPATVTTGARQTSVGVATKFYTYKRDVPLSGGQTVHFHSGRGYYAA